MTTKFRHPHVASLRGNNSKTNLAGRLGNLAKKSAVQMLQETKAFYVKSETVLDKKQEFRPVKVSETAAHGNFGQADQKENRLQEKLRLLLDFDSIESSRAAASRNEDSVDFCSRRNFEANTCFQHKSLPDLHLSPSHSSVESSDSSLNGKCDGDSRSAYSSLTQPERRFVLRSNSGDCKRCVDSNNDFKNGQFQTRSRLYASFRVIKSGELAKTGEMHASYRRRCSNASSCNRSRHNSSSKHSQSADSGRQSQGGSIGLRTGRSGLPEFPLPVEPKTVWSDSGTEDDFPPLFRSEKSTVDRKRPILRSKSDISHKYCQFAKGKPLLSLSIRSSLPATTEKLERFFDHLGMDPVDYKELASNNSRTSSPVYFSRASSVDSCVDMAIWSVPEPCKVAEYPSIVERNARIIKWLYNCRKFQRKDDFK